jgi:hypothetical protein
MISIRIVAIAVGVSALAAGGWWFVGYRDGTSELSAPRAHIAVRWRGRYQGAMTLPATLNWCPGTRRGILEALSGDSGVAVVLYERDSLTSGPHVVASPDIAASNPTPSATVVVRWMQVARDTVLAGFRSQGGTVRINLVGGQASGDVNARMRSLSGTDTLVVQGAFRDVPVVTTAAGCS